jgi:hypothetical protein
MSGTLIVDLSYFLDEHGDLAPLPGPALRLFEHLAAIIVMASHPDSEALPEYQVLCRRRPLRKPCPGIIQTGFSAESDDIIWWCPVCKDTGIISNWQRTIWDMTAADIEH